jgi:hypothetical protein
VHLCRRIIDLGLYEMQEGACQAMEACASKKPNVVFEVLSGVGNNHKSPQYLDRVLLVAGRAKRNITPRQLCTNQMRVAF